MVLATGNGSRLWCRWCKRCLRQVHQRLLSTSGNEKVDPGNSRTNNPRIRNIGILAHIDAGKTTTTERMLFYSGKIRNLGEVHRGNTVTDYLSQERERGITICSSAVTFTWNQHKINLLDTPGHIDFTMEVEQSLRAVDGVVVVLDGTAGVEAQTTTVWAQAEKYGLPKLCFINKMDRPDADHEQCLIDLQNKLATKTICLQWPEKDAKGTLSLYDIIRLEHTTWDLATFGKTFQTKRILDEKCLLAMQEKRQQIIDILSGVDDELAEVVITDEGFDKVTNELIYAALRRSTCQQKVVPVLMGSAYKNIGIQKLMDSINLFLPQPNDRNLMYNCFGNDFVGRVFKIVHDKQKGALTLLRVLRGTLKKGQRLISNRGLSEVVGKLYEPLADEYREIDIVGDGDVVLCAGLKQTLTGDLLVSSTVALKNAQEQLRKTLQLKNTPEMTDSKDEVSDLFEKELLSLETEIPDPVYFCSIEPPSSAFQTAMETALNQLQREDPSLRVTYDATTGQTVLGGMGELHMDIIKSRLLTEYKIEVDLGPLQIAYKETIENPSKMTLTMEKDIAGSAQYVAITLELLKNCKDLFSLDKSPENMANLKNLRPRTLQVIRKGCLAALERGPKVGGPLIDTQIKLHNVTIGRGTADSFIMATTAQCIQKILIDSGTRLLEPIMHLEIVVSATKLSAVLSDLSRKRAIIEDILHKGQNKVILAKVPLAELTKYSSVLRTLTSGEAHMTMQPCGFALMQPNDEEVALRNIYGFE